MVLNNKKKWKELTTMFQNFLGSIWSSENNSQYANVGSKGQLTSEALSILISIFICTSIYKVSLFDFASVSASTWEFPFVSVFV